MSDRARLLQFVDTGWAREVIQPSVTIWFGLFGLPYLTEQFVLRPRPLASLAVYLTDGVWHDPSARKELARAPLERIDDADVIAGRLRPGYDPGFPCIRDYFWEGRFRPSSGGAPTDRISIAELSLDSDTVLHAYFEGKLLVLERLGHRVEMDLSDFPYSRRFDLALSWSPVYIEIRCGWFDEQEEYRERKVRTPHKVTLPTLAQLDEIPGIEREYQSEADFNQDVVESLDEIGQQFRAAAPSAFWDFRERGSQSAMKRKPKREPDCANTLAVLLRAKAKRKGWRINREDCSRSGAVDFGVVAAVGGTAKELKIELKCAHSAQLLSGLVAQLPRYLEEHRCPGVYWVLWFKGAGWDEPADYANPSELQQWLTERKPTGVVGVVVFDAAYGPSASRL